MGQINSIVRHLEQHGAPFFAEFYGSEPEHIKQQQNAYIRLLKKFLIQFNDSDVFLFSSPGRTEIGGNHTDHNHGRVLAGAVNLDNIAVAAKNRRQELRFWSEGYRSFEVDITDLKPKPDEKHTSAALVRGIVARLAELGYAIGGFDVCIDGRVPKGSGLSSSASFEVLVGVIISELFNAGTLSPLENALIGQYAENKYFGKPCGLMDQTACAVGGFITIDFKAPHAPVVDKIDFDFKPTGYSLVITDTGGSHAHLSDEYATLPAEMKQVAGLLGGQVMRDVTREQLLDAIPSIRKKTGDRAILRALHFLGDNQRVAEQVNALQQNDFQAFLTMVNESGYSSFMYNQNIFTTHHPAEQSVSLGLALSELVLKGRGAWRVHGGGFAGTIQAFVPNDLLTAYTNTLEHVFGTGSCLRLSIREKGACMIAV